MAMQKGSDKGPGDGDGDEHGEEDEGEHQAPGGSGMDAARFGIFWGGGRIVGRGHKFQCTAGKFCKELAKIGRQKKSRGNRGTICNTSFGKVGLIK